MDAPFLGFALRLANTADCLFTVLLHLSAAGLEANPAMAGLISFSWPLFAVVKLFGVAALSLVLVDRKQRVVLGVLTVALTGAAAANAALWVTA